MQQSHLIQIAGLKPDKQIPLFESVMAARGVALSPQVAEMLTADCVVAIGVSGGKDSQACALQDGSLP